MPRIKGVTRNPELVKGLRKYSRSQMYHRKGRWLAAKKGFAKVAPKAKATLKVKEFGKKKEKRTIYPKTPRFYPTEPVHRRLPHRKTLNPTRLRKTITPGTVLILLAGRFRGRRVIFLKQLESGLLLVTGPYKINGVPARRVNQAYVIATSTKIDISKVKVDAKYNDDYFRKPKKEPKKKSETEFFATEAKKKKAVAPHRKDDQKALDSSILEIVKKTPYFEQYLGSRFSLNKNQAPHNIKF